MSSSHSRIIDEGFQPVGNGTRKALGMGRVHEIEKKRKRKEPKIHKLGHKHMNKKYARCKHCGNQILKNKIEDHISFSCRMRMKKDEEPRRGQTQNIKIHTQGMKHD